MLRLTLPWKERDCRMANRGPTFFAKTLSRYFFEYLPSERGLSQETIQSYRDAMSLLYYDKEPTASSNQGVF